MRKRGQKPKGTVKIEWSANFAYAIGLIATDGSLSRDGRHINFTSKDLEMIRNFETALCIEGKYTIGKKTRGSESKKRYFVIQISDVLFYMFLVNIGLTPAKSLTIGKLLVPEEYFFDFLRGCFDRDGYSYSYWDSRWKSSYMFYVGFCSASLIFIVWLQLTVYKLSALSGHITKSKNSSCYQLKYSKRKAIRLSSLFYSNPECIKLSRKYLKIRESLGIVRGHKTKRVCAGGEISRRTTLRW